VSWRDNSYRFIKVRRKYKEKLPDEVATVKVTTSRGNWLEGTTEHPFLTVRGGLLAWVPAGELQVGDLVAMASRVPAAQTPAEQFTPELAELLAWQVAEGHERPDTPSLTISQHDRTVLERLQTLFRQVVPSSDSGHIHDRKKALCIWSVDYCRLLQTIGYAWGKKSAGKALPQCAFSASHSTVVTVLRSLFDAEGNAEPACISFTSASSSLIDQVQYLLLQLGVRSAQHYAMKCATNGSRIYRPYGRLTISGYDLEEYSRSVGFSYAHKQAKLVAAAGKKRNPNCGVPAGFALDRLRQLGLLKSCGVGTVATTTVSYHLADRLCTGIRALTTDTGLVRYREILAGKRRAGPLARKQCANVVAAVEQYRDELARLEHAVQKMRDYDLRFEAVASVERGQFGGYVYDIEVDCDDYDDKNYVAGSGAFVVHNSLGSLAAAEAYGQPYTAIVPAALRPTYLAERKKFTDGSVPAQVMSYTELARGKPVQYPDSLVFDEAHRLRSPGSAAAQRAQELAQKARQVVMLSGTPTVNSPGDMAPLVSMLASKKLDPEGFEERYVRQRKVQPGFLDQLRGVPAGEESVVNHEDELKALLQGHVDYYSPEKPVVPVTQEDHVVEMGPEQTQLYRAMWDQLPFYLRWKLQNQFPLSRQELLRLRSFLSGPRQVGLSTLPYLKDKDPRTAFQQSTKLQKALSLMQESLKDERVKGLVFSNFIDAGLRPYASALEDAGVPHGLFHGGLNDKERKKLVDDYNAGKIRVALIGPSGTEGLSFKGTQVLQQLDEHFHPVRSRQAKGRGLRYDSHWGLPDDLQNLRVQRFVSRLPPSLVNRVLAKVWLGSAEPTPAVDDHLRNLSDRKEKLNSKFLDLLREVGTPSPGESVR
jgi:superfamily II DNA or RNA helicase